MISTKSNMPNKYVFVYDLVQGEFYFSKGITPLKVGVGTKGDTFIQFQKSKELQSAFDEWCNRWRPIT